MQAAITQKTCAGCGQALQNRWKLCPHCGVTASHSVKAPNLNLSCPSCAAGLPMLGRGEVQLDCPFCQSTLLLNNSQNGMSYELADKMGQVIGNHVGKAVGEELRKERAQQQTVNNTRRKQRQMNKAHNEVLSLYVGCIGTYGVFFGLFPKLAADTIGFMLLAGALLSGMLLGFIKFKSGSSLQGAILKVVLIGAFTFGLEVSVMWYFTQYLPSTGPLINLSSGD